jgi:hypothetical protein
MASLDSEWGPFISALDARQRLTAYVDQTCGREVGVVWASNGGVYPFRAPLRDGAGYGDVLVFQWSQRPAPPPRPPTGFWNRARRFIKRCLEMEGQAMIAQSQAELAMGQAINKVVSRAFTAHRDDGLGVALDIVCIGLSIALIPTGLGFVGLMGFVGGAFLLGADSYAYALELGGADADAEAFKKQTEKYRIIATVMTLPDVVYGGFKAVRELQEIRELRALDEATARAAERLGASTSDGARAVRYEQIAEKAHLRSQIRTEQIKAAFAHEIAPRGSGVGGTVLLIREEITSDESSLKDALRRLNIHSLSVRR